MINLISASLLVVTSSLVAAPPAVAPSATGSYRSLVQDSALAIDQGRFEDAITAIDAAQAQLEIPMAELAYNRAVANYRLGNWPAAASDFTEAIALTDDQSLLSDSVYNLGNVTHRQVVESLQAGNETGAQQAIDQLETAQAELDSALNHYRTAIESQVDDGDARANAEMTWDLIKQLQQMQEQLEQQQQQQQDQQQQQQQQDQQQQDQQQQDQQQQDQQQQDQQQQDQQQQDQQQQDQQQQDQQQQDQQQQDQQQEDQEQEDQEEQDQQKDSEQEDDAEATSSSSKASDDAEASEPRMTREEAERLLQSVRDKERQRRREKAEAEERRPKKPVERDW
ncbi:MAG: hypothetical protein P8K80_08505 [Phycisphaerales bacterium]|nr:hypothetical protein [Phycisphaerales bacterium]